jgi:stress response protein YsnF
MTSLEVIKSWPREQLESAFSQREKQLELCEDQLEIRRLYADKMQRDRTVALKECDALRALSDESQIKLLRDELAQWQTAFGMFKGTPQELASQAVKDAAELTARDEALRVAKQNMQAALTLFGIKNPNAADLLNNALSKIDEVMK